MITEDTMFGRLGKLAREKAETEGEFDPIVEVDGEEYRITDDLRRKGLRKIELTEETEDATKRILQESTDRPVEFRTEEEGEDR